MGLRRDHQPLCALRDPDRRQHLRQSHKDEVVGMLLSPTQRILRAFAAWAVVALFVFPIYYWITVAFKVEREIFSLPPKVFSVHPELEVFRGGLWRFLGLRERPGSDSGRR